MPVLPAAAVEELAQEFYALYCQHTLDHLHAMVERLGIRTDILRDRVKAGIEQARKDGKPHERPITAGKLVPEMKQACNI